ncbi:MAG: hypothetical protein WC677_02410 [Clostridia bacterium]|jgi:hypothetical protein
MNYSLFLSSCDCGQSEIALHAAKRLANLDKNVLVIDITKSQKIYFSLCLNKELEKDFKSSDSLIIEREGVDILINNPQNDDRFDRSKILNIFDFSEYNYILVIADDIVSDETFTNATNRFIFQDFYKEKLTKNKLMIDRLGRNKPVAGYEVVINGSINCKIKKEYILHILGEDNFNGVEIPFSEADYVASLNAIATGKINNKNYSKSYKIAIKKIAEKIDSFR